MKSAPRRVSGVARRYARALLEVATQRKAEDPVGEEVGVLSTLFRDDAVLRRTLTDPMVQQGRREEILNALLDAAKPREEVAELLRQMLLHGRLERVSEMDLAYQEILDEQRGIVEAEVSTPRKLTKVQRGRLSKSLQKMTGKKVRLAETVDPSLLGGVTARIGDSVYDASVKGRLQQIRREMAGVTGD